MGVPLDIQLLCERAKEYRERDRSYPLQGESWYTGFSHDGRQMLVVYDDANATVSWFNGDGQYMKTEIVPHDLTEQLGGYFQRDDYPQLEAFLRERFGFRDGPIQVRPFQDRVSGVAVKPLPYWLEDFVVDPERTPEQHRQEVAEWVQEWLEKRDTYALEAWGNTFFIDSNDGHCTAS